MMKVQKAFPGAEAVRRWGKPWREVEEQKEEKMLILWQTPNV